MNRRIPFETVPRIEEEFSHGQYERIESSFPRAVDGTLVPLFESLQKGKCPDQMPEGLSRYERALWEDSLEKGSSPRIRFLVDIDGVLIDTDEKVRDFFRKARSRSFADAFQVAGEKMEYPELKALLRCRNAASDSEEGRRISIITDRLFGRAECFPCFNTREREIFSRHGIETRAMILKPIVSGKKFAEVTEHDDLIYYFGSNATDQRLARRIRERMASDGMRPECLVYIEIRPNESWNIL